MISSENAPKDDLSFGAFFMSLVSRYGFNGCGDHAEHFFVLIGAIVVDDNDEIMLINSKGTIIRIAAKEISRLGRATQGVKIMRVGDDIEIISMSKVINEEERAQMAEKAQKQREKKKAEKKAAEAKAEREKAKAAKDDGTEQTEFDI